MDVNERVSYWLELAAYDLETAMAMLQTKRLLYVGFMCHQVIEKMLKAYYTYKLEGVPPFIHNLTILAKRSRVYDEMSEVQQEFIILLEPLNIKARYPSYKNKLLKTFTEEKCKQILKNTEDLYLWIKKRLIET